MNAPEKIVDRQRFIGGSDAARILGLAPKSWKHATPLDCYLEKIGQLEPEVDIAQAKLFRRGKREEPFVVDDLIEDYGVKVTKRSSPQHPNRYIDPEHSFLAAEIDFEWEVTPQIAALVSEQRPDIAALIHKLVGTIQNGEVKTHHVFAAAKFGDEGTEDTPIEYATQAMHGLMVTGRQITMFGVRSTLDDLRVYWIIRDDQTIAAMRPRLVGFWKNHVRAGVPPDPIRLDDVLTLFRMAPPIVVEADEALFKKVCEFEEAKAVAKAAADRIDDLKFDIGKTMLGQDAIARVQKKNGTLEPPRPTAAALDKRHMLKWGGEPVLTIALEKQSRIDSDAVRKKYPEVASECSKETKFFKFREPTKNERLFAR